jgi:hypothetical protein
MLSREQIVDECEALARVYKEELLHAFPYDDLGAVKDWGGSKYSDIIPALDLYWSRIAGYSSWGKRMLQWDSERRAAVRSDCSMSFFDKHPEFSELRFVLDLFPVLKRDLELYESARKRVLKIVAKIEEITIDSTPAE